MSNSLSKRRHPKELLLEHGLIAKKSFGQNFLVDPHHLDAIAMQVASMGQYPVVEIGSGLGALTDHLLRKKMRVYAIERDRDMARIFRQEFASDIESKNVNLLEDNATTFDYLGLLKSENIDRFILCGNLPYHLTSSLIFKTLDLTDKLAGAVFMIQKEVAERIVAAPGSRDYGILSVLVQVMSHVSLTHDVPSGAFWPMPKVDSSVISLVPISPRKLTNHEFADLTTLVKAAFSKRRKTLRNCLKDLVAIDRVCEKIGISAEVRAEVLSPDQFLAILRISKELEDA